ncbi:hypothetical protein PMZ80_006719 [Knufia obscura]|nr:hypothetical protein PMZ80_006719 [Knufia obscura]
MAGNSQARSPAPAQRPLVRRTSGPTEGDNPPQRPLVRRTTDTGAAPAPVLRRTAPPQGGQGGQGSRGGYGTEGGQSSQPRQSSQGGQLLRRTAPQSGSGGFRSSGGSGQLLRRVGGQQGGVLQRTRSPSGTTGRTGPGGRGQSRRPQGPQTDRRRRRATREGEDDEHDSAAVEQQMDEYITKYVDRPPNPTEPVPYNPTNMTLEALRADWPNTAMTTSGMTESVIQKIEWLARRLPHGYQGPEQIAEHYLKGNLTRFESEEEKQQVLKIAAEMSAKTKLESEEGTLHKHETPRFQIVKDPAFTSMSDKSSDKGYLVQTSVKGDYGEVEKQRYPFMQNAARMLNNNGSYGPAQMQRLLDRVQTLIPQGRTPAAQQIKKA